jgi:HSP20 family protein
MAIVRWEPFRDLVSLQERMNRLFDESFRSRAGAGAGQEDDWALGGSWAPAVDIYEHDGNIVLKAEVPGVDPKEVDVRVENNVLTLRGERKIDNEIKRESYHRVERAYGSFSRSFTLPNVVDTENIRAEYKDGVLRVTLPKREEAKPRQISINVSR